MHRTHLGGLAAIALPLTLSIHWTVALPIVATLFVTRSWTAWLASSAGVLWLYPEFLPVALGSLFVLALASWSTWTLPRQGTGRTSLADHLLPHGAGLDGLRGRLISWAYLARTWSWRGGDVRLALEQASIRSNGMAMEGGPARNEFIELAYRYGLAGVLAAAVILAAGWWLMVPGSPVSATLLAAGVILSGTSPLQALKRWLTGHDGALFGPPVLATLTIHIDAEGQGHLYGKLPDPTTTQNRAMLALTARVLVMMAEPIMVRAGLTPEDLALPVSMDEVHGR